MDHEEPTILLRFPLYPCFLKNVRRETTLSKNDKNNFLGSLQFIVTLNIR